MKKYVNIYTVSFIIMMILFWLLIVFSRAAFEGFREIKSLSNTFIGEQVVVDKDTLTVVEYNEWADNFTLSNGVEVSFRFLEKQLKNKEQ